MERARLLDWLQQLAAAYGPEPRPPTIKAYLEILETWRLTDAQWTEMRRRAVTRYVYMPRISELDDLRAELAQESARDAANEHRRQIETGDKVPCPPEVRAALAGLKRVK